MNKKINLETYDVEETQDQQGQEVLEDQEVSAEYKKEGWFKRFWNNTVFPEMIKNKKEEKALRKEIESQARREAMVEMKDDLKQIYIQKEKDKLSGKAKQDFLAKLAKGFESSSVGSTEKLNMMLKQQPDEERYTKPIHRGYTPKPSKSDSRDDFAPKRGYLTSDEQMSDLLGVGASQKNVKRKKAVESREDRIRRMLK